MNTRWRFSPSDSFESWEGSYATKREAAEAGLLKYKDEAEIDVKEQRRIEVSALVPDPSWIFAHMQSAALALDQCGDVVCELEAGGFPKINKSKSNALLEVLVTWLTKNIELDLWRDAGPAITIAREAYTPSASTPRIKRRKLRKPDPVHYRKGMPILQRLLGKGNGDIIAGIIASNPKGVEQVAVRNSLRPEAKPCLRDPKILAQRTMVVPKREHDKVVACFEAHLSHSHNQKHAKDQARRLSAKITEELSNKAQRKLFPR